MVPGSTGCGSVVFPQTTTLAPSTAARMAMAWPMPLVAPVMSTVRPCRLIAHTLHAVPAFHSSRVPSPEQPWHPGTLEPWNLGPLEPWNCRYTGAPMHPRNVINDLRDLAKLTSTADGAQRLAWGPVWREARQWFNGKLAELGITPEIDAAGNSWATLRGVTDRTVIIGSHLDSVPNGGWLDGALGMTAGLEALRMFKDQRPPVTLRVVDWADEEGARFSRSLLGSSAASGSLKVSEVEHLADKTGVTLIDALKQNGVELSRMHESQN